MKRIIACFFVLSALAVQSMEQGQEKKRGQELRRSSPPHQQRNRIKQQTTLNPNNETPQRPEKSRQIKLMVKNNVVANKDS